MRSLSKHLRALINAGESFTFGFTIELNNEKVLNLTSYAEELIIDEMLYHPGSSLQITRANFNDSACDIVEVTGFFDDSAINILDDLNNAKVTIHIILPNQKIKEPLLTLFCFSIQRQDLQFTLYLKNQITKLGQSAVKIYSKTCRANLGDAKCRINLENFASIVNISGIENNLVMANFQQPDGYYDYGKINFIDTSIYILILKQTSNSLILESNVPQDLINQEKIKIFPGCDKTLETCYTKFSNVLNFRGEPFVPEFNYEKVF
jgi:hypothetical protein